MTRHFKNRIKIQRINGMLKVFSWRVHRTTFQVNKNGLRIPNNQEMMQIRNRLALRIRIIRRRIITINFTKSM